MWFRRILAVFALGIIGSSVLQAQANRLFYPPTSKLPWNTYQARRTADAFVSIIGQPGTTQIPGSATAAGSAIFTVALPFDVSFLTTAVVGQQATYTSGSLIRVAACGYVSFQAPSTALTTPDLSQATSPNQLIVAPYWSDIQPNGVVNGGIYWNVTGAPGSRVFTIEWRCQGIATPTSNPGNFQLLFFEGGTGTMEFRYGPTPITRSQTVGTKGAMVGIKYFGRSNVTPPTLGESDNANYLLIQNPDVNIDTIAITRTQAVRETWVPNNSVAYSYENQATWDVMGFNGTAVANGVLNGKSVSRYFHYTFPTEGGARRGYRIFRPANNPGPDSVAFIPARLGNAYPAGTTISVKGYFRNFGTNSISNVPVGAEVYRLGNPGTVLWSANPGTVFSTVTPPNGRDSFFFGPNLPASITGTAGTYIARVFTRMTSPADDDPGNDTILVPFNVIYEHDVRPTANRLLQPISNTPRQPIIYPVGTSTIQYPLPVEAEFFNLGYATEQNVPVGYIIYDGDGNVVFSDRAVLAGPWPSLTTRIMNFTPRWSPDRPGTFYIRVYTDLETDEQRANDTTPAAPGKPFRVAYEYELAALAGSTPGASPVPTGFLGGNYPDGRPIDIITAFRNFGILDATGATASVTIKNSSGTVVYSRTGPVLNVVGDSSVANTGGPITFKSDWPKFIPTASGTYCITVVITDSRDPLTSNNQAEWCFTVAPRLIGTIRVGIGERFRTIQEAHDSLYRYGVAGPVTFELINDVYTVRPANADPTLPALDGRGNVVGSGPNNPVTWRAADGKDSVQIILKSPSGVGIMYGQRDTLNPSGYITWDGGPRKKLRFILDTLGNGGLSGFNKAIPFYFTQAASNYAVRNSHIRPLTVPMGHQNDPVMVGLTLPTYNVGSNIFRYSQDMGTGSVALSAGIFVRNWAPQDQFGQNPLINLRYRDTLRNQGNVMDGNVISNFAYGIVSIGAGPLYRTQNPVDKLYEEYMNTNNQYVNNTITDVGRAGIAVVYEKGSTIGNNTISRVNNTLVNVPGAAGIAVTSGGYYLPLDTAARNRGYSTDLLIERNRVTDIGAQLGDAAGIVVQSQENGFTAGQRVFRFPTNGVTNMRIYNNMVWTFAGRLSGSSGSSVGIALTGSTGLRPGVTFTGNRVDHNSIFNRIAGVAPEYGFYNERHGVAFRNNIVAIATPTGTPVGVAHVVANIKQNVTSDYNLFWVPSGAVGVVGNISADSSFRLPSLPAMQTLNQWRALTALDSNSVSGDVVSEFVNLNPGTEDLHINRTILGALANNRGILLPDVRVDIDGDPRNAISGVTRPDIGADEFNGELRNHDLMVEDAWMPFGYRALTGQFSDAEYAMIDRTVPLMARFRNVGGQPQINNNTLRMRIQYWNGSGWVSAQSDVTRTSALNVTQAVDVNFGTFAPKTLSELSLNDAYFNVMRYNVSPIYRFTVSSELTRDDYSGNNVYQKDVRFFVRRSGSRSMLVSVERDSIGTAANTAATTLTGVALGNQLNTDTVKRALTSMFWGRAGDGIGNPATDSLEDYDYLVRDHWPRYNLNFTGWQYMIWAQGQDADGVNSEERLAIKQMLDKATTARRAGIVIAGQDISRIHDVNLTATNGQNSDTSFLRTYLRAADRGATNPVAYNNRTVHGYGITPNRYELINATGVAGDAGPTPRIVAATRGTGVARPTHYYSQLAIPRPDSAMGVGVATTTRSAVFYAVDFRHFTRFPLDPNSTGARRVLLGGLDFIDQWASILPVKLLTFDAYQSSRSQKAVTVEFETAAEENVASLEIERAEVSQTETGEVAGDYTLVGSRSPMGSATTGAEYRLNDHDVVFGKTYRYRLVTVNLDGSRTVDAERSVKVIGGNEAAGFSLAIAPNPATSNTTISFRAPEGSDARIAIYDMNGSLVRSFSAEENASGAIAFRVDGLANGVYTVRLQTSTGVNLVEKLNVSK